MKNKARALISGDSFVENSEWPQILWPNANVTNLARSGSSNRYIADSIIDATTKNKFDHVFIIFTGINKLDFMVPSNQTVGIIAKKWKYYGEVGDWFYFFDGGDYANHSIISNYFSIKDPVWPKIENLLDFWSLSTSIKEECISKDILPYAKNPLDLESLIQISLMTQRLSNSYSYYQSMSLRSMASAIDHLERNNINYHFSFWCDPFAKYCDHPPFQGRIDKKHPYISRINWSRYIKLHPFEFALKNDYLCEDGFHATETGLIQYGKELNKIIC